MGVQSTNEDESEYASYNILYEKKTKNNFTDLHTCGYLPILYLYYIFYLIDPVNDDAVRLMIYSRVSYDMHKYRVCIFVCNRRASFFWKFLF